MYSKLYQYQVKELWYIARYFYLGMVGTYIISMLIKSTKIPGVVRFFNMLSILGFILCGVAILIFTVINDYQNQQGKRSYFFRSIPAQGSAILGSRITYYATYYFSTILMIIIGLTLRLVADDVTNMGIPFHMAFNVYKDLYPITKMVGIMIFLVIYTGTEFIISMMFAITIGSHAKFKSLGIGGPVLVYFLHYIAMQIINLISILFIPIAIKLPENFDSGFKFEIVFQSMMPEINKLFSAQSNEIRVFGIGFIFITFIVWIIMLVWIYKFSKNKISLN